MQNDKRDTPTDIPVEATQTPRRRTTHEPTDRRPDQDDQVEIARTDVRAADTAVLMDRAPLTESRSAGPGQAEAERRASINAQNERELRAAMQAPRVEATASAPAARKIQMDLDPTQRMNAQAKATDNCRKYTTTQENTQDTQQRLEVIEIK